MNELAPIDVALPERTIETITSEIRALQNQTLAFAVEIGRRLCEAKEMLPHGEWGKWLENEVDFSQSTANNLMRLFSEYGSAQSCLFGAETNSQTLGNLSYTKALRLLSVPAEERESFAAEHKVEELSTRELDEVIKQRDAALKEKAKAEALAQDYKRQADNAIVSADSRIAEAKKNAEAKTAEANRLAAELKALKDKPIDVAVQQPSEEDIEKAVAKASKASEAEHKKQIADLEKRLKEAESEKVKAESTLNEAQAKADSAVQEAAKALAELEKTRKHQSMADPAIIEFKVLFEDVQNKLSKLLGLAKGATDDNSEKFTSALKEMLKAFEERVGGAA